MCIQDVHRVKHHGAGVDAAAGRFPKLGGH